MPLTLRAPKGLAIATFSLPTYLLPNGGARPGGKLCPVYVRGEAYLAVFQGNEAAAEFQEILDHRGIVLNEPIGVLAHLGLARACALSGDTAKARAAYQDFLTFGNTATPTSLSSPPQNPNTPT
jgi:hypothetical protein